MPSARVIVSLVFCLFFLVLIGFGLTYSWGARFAPLAVGTGGLILSLAQVVSEVRADDARDAPTEQDRRAVRLMAWLVGLVTLALTTGILPGSFVFIAAYARMAMRRTWAGSFAVATATVPIIYFFFEILLGLDLFDGWLAAYLVSNAL